MVAIAAGVGTAVAGVAGAAMSSSAAGKAAKGQAEASDRAAQLQAQQYEQTRSDLEPYRNMGNAAAADLQGRLGEFNQNNLDYLRSAQSELPQVPSWVTMTQEDLERTPGYQFTLSQGLRAVQNSAAARGLGVSGAAMRGAAQYATGLSDQTYNTRLAQEIGQRQQIFANQQSRFGDILGLSSADQAVRSNTFNRLTSLAGLGQNAAAQTGNYGAQAAQAQGQAITSGANAVASGQIAQGNAMQSGINSIANGANQYLAMRQLQGGGMYGSGASNDYGMFGQNYQQPFDAAGFGT